MPSLDTARRVSSIQTGGAQTVGQMLKNESDYTMEMLWDNDLQSKVCYIYDYYHDDQPELKSHMTYERTTKTKIDAKFIVVKHQSIDKDQIEYQIQFKPSQKTEFEQGDDLYYFEENYRQVYGNDDFCGLYIDIPDEKGVYKKWLIIQREEANQFIKYLILPCDYRLCWIERSGDKIIKRKMYGTQRIQSSYTIGVFSDYRFSRPDNQSKIWLPLNRITEKLWYTDDDSKNMRVIVSAPTENPIVWKITKIENSRPVGIQKLTLYQDLFRKDTDYIEKDESGKIIGMWANYFDNVVEPSNPETPQGQVKNHGEICASTTAINVGGSYKLLTAKIYDCDGAEITQNYSSIPFEWTCSIGEQDMTEEVTWLDQTEFNKKKIKFPKDRSYLNKILVVKCKVGDIEFSKEFELII